MRIDEVIQEAPVGAGQRFLNFVGSKNPFSAQGRARAQGRRDTAAIANNANLEIQKLMGQQNLDNKSYFSPEFEELLQNYFLSKKVPQQSIDDMLGTFRQQKNKLAPDGQAKPASLKKMGGKGGVFDKWLLSITPTLAKVIPANVDTDGDGKPDAPQDGAQDDNANLSPADSALKSALDKLDPEMQKKALAYLQSKS